MKLGHNRVSRQEEHFESCLGRGISRVIHSFNGNEEEAREALQRLVGAASPLNIKRAINRNISWRDSEAAWTAVREAMDDPVIELRAQIDESPFAKEDCTTLIS